MTTILCITDFLYTKFNLNNQEQQLINFISTSIELTVILYNEKFTEQHQSMSL